MSTDPVGPPIASLGDAGTARLNPFAYPSSTDARFLLLVMTVVSACLLTLDRLSTRASDGRLVQATLERCGPLAQASIDAGLRGIQGGLGDTVALNRAIAETEALDRRFRQCVAPYARWQARWMAGGVLLMLGLALVWYGLAAVWEVRRRGLVPLPPDDEVPGLRATLQSYCREAGLRRPPTFLVAPLEQSAAGLAFGRGRRHFVALNNGLVTRFLCDRPLFRAVVLHELAHLRNADVGKAYFSVAATYAFLAVAVLPDVVTMPASREPASWAFERAGRVLALGALVYLTRNATLRAREVYADVRASAWDGPGGALARLLERMPEPRRRWHRYLMTHPSATDRRRTLTDTRPLFARSGWEAFATGLTATIAFSGFFALAQRSAEAFARGGSRFAQAVGGAVTGPLVAGVLGVGAWRAAFVAAVSGGRPRDAWRVALGFAVGCLTAHVTGLDRVSHLDFLAAVVGVRSLPDAEGVGRMLAWLAWGGLVFGVTALLLRWVETGAEAWLAVSPGPPRTRTVLVLTAGVFAVCYGVLFYPLSAGLLAGRDPESWSAVARQPILFGLVLVTSALAVPGPLAVGAVVSVWAYPFAALLGRRTHGAGGGGAGDPARAAWAYLDPRVPLSTAAPHRLSPRQAVRRGLTAVVPFAAVLLAVRYGWWTRLAQVVRDEPAMRFRLFGVWVMLAALTQSVAAALSARRVPERPVVHGMLTASAAAVGAALFVYAHTAVLSASWGIGALWYYVCWFVVSGALPAAGAAWLASVCPHASAHRRHF